MQWHLDIYLKYLPDYQIGKVIASPIRTVKSGVQFEIRLGDNGRYYWKDYGHDSMYGHDIYAFVAEMEHIDREAAVEKVREWRDGGKFERPYRDKPSAIDSIKYPTIFDKGPLTKQHLHYYDSLFVNEYWLNEYRMKACKSIRKGPNYIFKASKENFGFHWSFGESNKAYLPFNYWGDNRVGWFHTNLKSMEGWDQINWMADHIIITKSMKDVLVLRSCGYNAICVSGEAMVSKLLSVMSILTIAFPSVYLWFDPDEAGDKGTAKIVRYFPYIKLIHSKIAKDPSDIIIETNTRFWIHQIIQSSEG